MSQTPARRPFSTAVLPWILLAVVVVLVIVVFLVKRGEPPQAADDTSSQQPSEVVGAADARSVPRAADEMPPAGAIRAAERAAVQAEVDKTRELFTLQYRSEKTDPAWAPAKERELAELSTSNQIRDLKADVQNLKVDCKTSMCKITGDFKTMTAGDDWFILYMNNVGPKVPTAVYKYVNNPDGTLTMEIYAVGRK